MCRVPPRALTSTPDDDDDDVDAPGGFCGNCFGGGAGAPLLAVLDEDLSDLLLLLLESFLLSLFETGVRMMGGAIMERDAYRELSDVFHNGRRGELNRRLRERRKRPEEETWMRE